MALTAQQEAFFKNSKVRGADGNLLVAYHGTGAIITAFDPAYTGQGNDQYGSGFYFSTNREVAEGYTDSTLKGDDGKPLPKPGGDSHPNVIAAYINMGNPIIVDGNKHSNLRHIIVSAKEAEQLFRYMPTLYHQPGNEEEPNPLGDYFPYFWERNRFTEKALNHMIQQLAIDYFNPTNMLLLDVFFASCPTIFRKAIKEVLGFDGIVVNFADGSKHIVAWFPEQIKLVTNGNPKNSPFLADYASFF